MSGTFGGGAPSPGTVLLALVAGVSGAWVQLAQVLSDLLVGATYIAVALTIALMLYRARRTALYDRAFFAVVAIVGAFGTVHLVRAVAEVSAGASRILVGLQGVMVLAAIVSALLLPRLIPKALAIVESSNQSSARKRQLELVNDVLQRDIAEREKIAAALSASERRLRALITGAPLLLFSLDEAGHVQFWEGHATDLLGVPPERITGQSIFELAKSVPEFITDIERALAGEHVTSIRAIAGRTYEMRYVPQVDPAGRRGGVIGVATDVSERLRIEEELRRSQQDYRLIFDTAPIGIAIVDGNARTVRANPAVGQLFNSTEVTTRSYDALDYTHPDDLEVSKRLFTELRDGHRDRYQLEKRYFSPAGQLRWVHLTLAAVRDAEGHFLHAVSMMQDITDRKRAEEALRASEASLATAQEIAHVGSWDWDLVTGTLSFSAELYRVFGVDPASYTPSFDGFLELVHPADRDRVNGTMQAAIRGEQLYDVSYRLIRPDGNERFIHARGKVEWNEARQPMRVFGTAQDITERERVAAELRTSEERYRTILDQIDKGYFEADRRGNLTFFNSKLSEILGFREDELRGMSTWQFMSGDSARRVKQLLMSMYRSRRTSKVIEWEFIGKSGRTGTAETSVTLMRDREGRPVGYRGVLRDITIRKENEDRLAFQAFHDPLTGLANRALFLNRLEHALVRSRSNYSVNAVLFLDLDRFKGVNDSHGHAAGDQLLRVVASRLRECVRAGDTVSRLGGDEFTILLEELGSVQDAIRVAEDINRIVAEPVLLDNDDVRVTTSIGIAMTAGHGRRSEDLLHEADIAMYRAKARGKAQYDIFDANQHGPHAERLAEETRLRHALTCDELTPHFLPQVCLPSGQIFGIETRMYWNHPERGALRMEQFGVLAEESGLIVPIGRWLLEQACRHLLYLRETWPAAAPHEVSVQLTPRQFHDERLVDDVRQLLNDTAADPARLVLTVGATAVMEDAAQASVTMNALKGLGVRLAVARLGAGASSLAMLQRLPVDRLVMDRALVARIGAEDQPAGVVSAILVAARARSMEVVARGVETAEQLVALRALGCDRVQGSYISGHLPVEAFAPHFTIAINPPEVRAEPQSVGVAATA